MDATELAIVKILEKLNYKNMLNSYMILTNEYNLIMFNRFFTKTAKYLRELLAENVSIVKVSKNHTREILSNMFSEKVQELYAGIYSKELKILPTTSEN